MLAGMPAVSWAVTGAGRDAGSVPWHGRWTSGIGVASVAGRERGSGSDPAWEMPPALPGVEELCSDRAPLHGMGGA